MVGTAERGFSFTCERGGSVFLVLDTLNRRVVSRHRTIAAAVREGTRPLTEREIDECERAETRVREAR
jgi:hypothetical protein